MDPVSSTLPPTTGTRNAFNDLNSAEFVKIILTELSNQDPLKPSDSSALVEQMASLRSIESDISMGNRLQTLVSQNQLASAASLMGKLVTGINTSNQRVVGYVESVSRTDRGAILNLSDGSQVLMDNVDEMLDPTVFEPRDDNGPSGPSTPTPPTPPAPPSNSTPPDNSDGPTGEEGGIENDGEGGGA